jgi:3-oxoacyl-[acyl-carrier-protein] synthase-3
VNGRGVVKGAYISALGVHVPDETLTNYEIARLPGLDTSDEWISKRTGIRERRVARDGESPSDLGIAAAKACLASREFDPADVDLVIGSSLVPDMIFPATASVIAKGIGAVNAGAFDVQAGCAGYMYGLAAAIGFVSAGLARHVLVVGAETLTRALDWRDRSTCILFGDGAGATLVSATDNGTQFHFDLGNDGGGAPFLNLPAGGARLPASHETVEARQHFLKMDGPEVYKFATRKVVESCANVMAKAGVQVADVDLFVPHQANLRIIDYAARRLGFRDEQVFYNLDRYGNTSCASIPLCLAEAQESGRLKKGDTVLLVGFGAGLTWGTCLTTWEL